MTVIKDKLDADTRFISACKESGCDLRTIEAAAPTRRWEYQHNGLSTRGTQSLAVSVVPDSGTEQLAGLTGTMEIIIDGGRHDYRLRYRLPA